MVIGLRWKKQRLTGIKDDTNPSQFPAIRLLPTLLSSDQERVSEDSATHVIDTSDELRVVELRREAEVVREEQLCGDLPQLLNSKGTTEASEGT